MQCNNKEKQADMNQSLLGHCTWYKQPTAGKFNRKYKHGTLCQASLKLTVGHTKSRMEKHVPYTYVNTTSVYGGKLQQTLDLLTTGGEAEQRGDFYKQTDTVLNSALKHPPRLFSPLATVRSKITNKRHGENRVRKKIIRCTDIFI